MSRWRSKWRYVVVYWLLQAAVVHAGWSSLMAEKDLPRSLGEIGDRILNGNMMFASLFLIVPVTCFQAVLLLPVRRPGMRRASVGIRIVHNSLCAVAIAMTVWIGLWPALATMEELGFRWIGNFDAGFGFSLVVLATVWIVAFALLWRREQSGTPVFLSLGIAILCAALLVAGFVGGIAALIHLTMQLSYEIALPAVMGGFLLGWLVFTPLLLSFCRKKRTETALARISAGLFIGTIVEAAAAIPLDVMIRRKTDCYCETGTFWALTFCWAIGSLALGPMIFLAPFSKRRKRWYAGRCEVCNYDMTGCMTAERCPECGAGWKPTDEDRAAISAGC